MVGHHSHLLVLVVLLACRPNNGLPNHKGHVKSCVPTPFIPRNVPDQNTPVNHVNFLITGCPRSGTRFLAKFLSLNDIRVSHEKYRTRVPDVREADEGIVSWVMAADADKTPWGPAANNFSFNTIIHQVRNPFDSIRSIARNEQEATWTYVCKFFPHIPCFLARNESGWKHLDRAGQFWYSWNLLAESKAVWTYRTETLKTPETRRRLESLLGLRPNALDWSKTDNISRRAAGHTQFRRSLTEVPLDVTVCMSPYMLEKVLCLGERYGYNMSRVRHFHQNPNEINGLFQKWASTLGMTGLSRGETEVDIKQLYVRACCRGSKLRRVAPQCELGLFDALSQDNKMLVEVYKFRHRNANKNKDPIH